ncbi:MAG: DUF4157 domain-containing protein [Anaerolineaceae bacterium]
MPDQLESSHSKPEIDKETLRISSETTETPGEVDFPIQALGQGNSSPRSGKNGAPFSHMDTAQVARNIKSLQAVQGNLFVQRLIQFQKNQTASSDQNNMSQSIQQSLPGGHNLDQSTRESLEEGLGSDMSGVKIHTDNEADRLARSVDSVAFTTGQDIFFKSGAYNPASTEGLHLLAHEATHTIQQSNGSVDGTPAQGGVSISDPSDRYEQAADQSANQFISRTVQGTPSKTTDSHVQRQVPQEKEEEEKVQTRRTGAPNPSIQRQTAPEEEEEEEKVQTHRTGAPNPSIQRQTAPEEEEEEEKVQTRRTGAPIPSIQRQTAPEEEEEEEKVQTRRTGVPIPSIQRQTAPEEEEEEEKVQTRRTSAHIPSIQRQTAPEEEEEEEKVQTSREGKPAIALQRNGPGQTSSPTSSTTPSTTSATASGNRPTALSPEEQAFFNMTQVAFNNVETAAGLFSQYLSGITIPYALAWAAHKAAMTSAGEAAKNANELVLSVVFGAIPEAAAAGRITNVMNKLAGGEAIVDKDMVGKLVSGGMSKLEHAAAPETNAGFQRMPTDPLVWQNQANQRAQQEVLNPARMIVLSWQNAVTTHDPNCEIDFDPVSLVRSSLTMDGMSLFSLPTSFGNLQQGYERGFLTEWIQTESDRVSIHESSFSWGKARDKIVAYARSIGMPDVEQQLSNASQRGSDERRERAIREHHYSII